MEIRFFCINRTAFTYLEYGRVCFRRSHGIYIVTRCVKKNEAIVGPNSGAWGNCMATYGSNCSQLCLFAKVVRYVTSTHTLSKFVCVLLPCVTITASPRQSQRAPSAPEYTRAHRHMYPTAVSTRISTCA